MILEPTGFAAERQQRPGAFKNNMRLCLTLPLIAGIALLALAGCGGREKNVVTVDNEGVSQDDFYQYLTTKRTVRVVVQGQVVEVPVAETLAFQAMQELATRSVVMHMAQDEGLMPTEKEIDDEIKFQQKIDPNYITARKQAGFSMGQIKREVKYSICEERLLTRGIKVEKSEVDQMIKDNPEQFVEPATIRVYECFVTSDTRKNLVDRELAASQPFKSVAAKYTQNPNGPLRQFAVKNMEEPLKSALGGLNVGQSSDWIKVGSGMYKFFVDARTEDKPMDLTPERREMMRRNLALAYGKQANDLSVIVAEKLRSADVRVNEDDTSLTEMWKRFKDRLEKSATDVEIDSAPAN